MTFDVALANATYSVKTGTRGWTTHGAARSLARRRRDGPTTPLEHMLSSLGPKAGVCAILCPQRILSRQGALAGFGEIAAS